MRRTWTGILLVVVCGISSVRAEPPRRVQIEIVTEYGSMIAELEADKAPATVANFLRYVDAGLYNDSRFHRTVKPDNQPENTVKIEVIQAGVAPERAKDELAPIKLERTRDTGVRHRHGTLSMARDGVDTATGDFFICLGDQPELDFGGKRNPDGQGFAAFGRVVQGLEIARKIQAAPSREQNLTPPIRIVRMQRLAAPFPPELVRFEPLPGNPVFTGAGPGHWDARIRERGWILREDGQYKLWYTGYDGTREGQRQLGYATSPDGLTWTRHPRNPLAREHWVEDVMVVKDGARYLMVAEGRNDQAHLLTSPDGLEWTRLGRVDVRQKNGDPISEGPYGTPTLWREKDLWYLFYERGDRGVWLATSADLKVWRHVQDEPVLQIGPGDYDRDQIALNQILRHQGRYYAYYHGCARSGPRANLWNTCVATSLDLVHWEKFAGNPLQPIVQNKSSGILVHDGKQYRLYTMHPEVQVHVPAPK